MAVVALSNSVLRLDDADATTNWTKLGSGVNLAQEGDFKYQGSFSVSSKVGVTFGGHYLSGAAAMPVDMTAGDDVVCLFKGVWTNKDILISVPSATHEIGSGSGDYHQYYIADDGTQGDIDYPAKGGFLISPINPNVSAWRDATVGTPTLTAVDDVWTIRRKVFSWRR